MYAVLYGRGWEEVVFEHLEQLASPNRDSDSQESVFFCVETLYNTVVSVWDNIIMLWLNDRHLVKVFWTLNVWQSQIFLKLKESKVPSQFKLSYAD